eukprot:Rmarinus@m.19066
MGRVVQQNPREVLLDKMIMLFQFAKEKAGRTVPDISLEKFVEFLDICEPFTRLLFENLVKSTFRRRQVAEPPQPSSTATGEDPSLTTIGARGRRTHFGGDFPAPAVVIHGVLGRDMAPFLGRRRDSDDNDGSGNELEARGFGIFPTFLPSSPHVFGLPSRFMDMPRESTNERQSRQARRPPLSPSASAMASSRRTISALAPNRASIRERNRATPPTFEGGRATPPIGNLNMVGSVWRESNTEGSGGSEATRVGVVGSGGNGNGEGEGGDGGDGGDAAGDSLPVAVPTLVSSSSSSAPTTSARSAHIRTLLGDEALTLDEQTSVHNGLGDEDGHEQDRSTWLFSEDEVNAVRSRRRPREPEPMMRLVRLRMDEPDQESYAARPPISSLTSHREPAHVSDSLPPRVVEAAAPEPDIVVSTSSADPATGRSDETRGAPGGENAANGAAARVRVWHGRGTRNPGSRVRVVTPEESDVVLGALFENLRR